jgi:hypothetical protein
MMLIRSALGALVLAVAGFACWAQPVPSDPVPLTYFGLHIHRADAGTAWPKVPFGSWRLWDAHVGWAQLEPERGKWDFTRLDKYAAMARITKTDILLPLAMTPRWAAARPDEPSLYRPGNSSEPASLVDWENYVAKVAERYKGRIMHYEVWNEPSDKGHFTGSPESLVRLTCAAYRVLKRIDPEIRVVSPASAGGGRHLEYLDNFLREGGKQCIDIVAHHFYVFRTGPESMIPLIRAVRGIMAKNGIEKMPLWNTETGWWIPNTDGTPEHVTITRGGWKRLSGNEDQGDYVLRAFLVARAEGVSRFYWYSWDHQGGLGLTETVNGGVKAGIEAKWRSAVELLTGAMAVQCTNTSAAWSCTISYVNQPAVKVFWDATGP